MTRASRLLSICLVLAVPGCASVGGSTKKQEVDAWAADSKQAIAEGAPQADAELAEDLRNHRERSAKVIAMHAEQAKTSNDVILGKTGFGNLAPAPLSTHIAFIQKHGLMPTPVPYEERRRGKFFGAPSDKAMKTMQTKAHKDKQFAEQVRIAIPTVDAIGAYLLKEQEGTLGVSWTTELTTMMLAARVVAFENQFEAKASEELLGEVALLMSQRDQARLQMATHTAMLATFEGVAHGGDPEAVMELAKASNEQIDQAPEVTTQTAREFVDELSDKSLDIAASLEATMRVAHGDEVYERHYQSELVRALAEIEKAEAEASLVKMIDDAQKQAHMTLVQEKAASVQERLTERAKSLGLEKAEQILGKLPFGSQIVAGIKALRELRNGNPREALLAAIEAVPSGPIKEGMKTATALGFAAEKAIKNRRRRG